jgi:hypothetical protein
MPLWLTKDSHGLSLFTGSNPPAWDDKVSTSNDEHDSEYLGEVPSIDAARIEISDGQTVQVELSRVR